MLVKRNTTASRWSIAARLRHDAGSTMVTVLIVMLVLTLGGLALSVLALNTAGVVETTGKRSEMQAEVDGVIATKSVDLTSERLRCDTEHKKPLANQTPEALTKNGGSTVSLGWSLYCSESGTVGTATIEAWVQGPGGAKLAKRNAVYRYTLTPVQVPNYDSPEDPIMMFGDNTTFNSNNVVVNPGHPVNVNIPYGNFTCNTKFPGNLTVKGNITVQGGCEVAGNVISITGSISGPSFIVGGDVLAKGNIDFNSSTSITGNVFSTNGIITNFNGAAKVRGNVTTGGTGKNFLGNIDGNVHLVGGLTSNSENTIKGTVIAGGDSDLRATVFEKTLTIPTSVPNNKINVGWSAKIQGAAAKLSPLTPGFLRPATIPAPTFPSMPAAPPWFEYKFKASDWSAYKTITLSGSGSAVGSCDYFKTSQGSWLTTESASSAQPLLIDARACSPLSTNYGTGADIKVSKNLVLLANSFDLTNAKVKAAVGAGTGADKPRVWLMKSDENPSDHAPTCNPTGDTKLNQSTFDTSISTMVYTPCTISVNGAASLNGQLYGGNWSGGGGAGITFSADNIGMPGMGGGTPSNGNGGGSESGSVVVSGSFTLQSSQNLSSQ